MYYYKSVLIVGLLWNSLQKDPEKKTEKPVLELILFYLPKKKPKTESAEAPQSTEEQEKPPAEPAAPPSAEEPSATPNIEEPPVVPAEQEPEPVTPTEGKDEEAATPSVSAVETVEDAGSPKEEKPSVSGQH